MAAEPVKFDEELEEPEEPEELEEPEEPEEETVLAAALGVTLAAGDEDDTVFGPAGVEMVVVFEGPDSVCLTGVEDEVDLGAEETATAAGEGFT